MEKPQEERDRVEKPRKGPDLAYVLRVREKESDRVRLIVNHDRENLQHRLENDWRGEVDRRTTDFRAKMEILGFFF